VAHAGDRADFDFLGLADVEHRLAQSALFDQFCQLLGGDAVLALFLLAERERLQVDVADQLPVLDRGSDQIDLQPGKALVLDMQVEEAPAQERWRSGMACACCPSRIAPHRFPDFGARRTSGPG
jgi:hypothetical protein